MSSRQPIVPHPVVSSHGVEPWYFWIQSSYSWCTDLDIHLYLTNMSTLPPKGTYIMTVQCIVSHCLNQWQTAKDITPTLIGEVFVYVISMHHEHSPVHYILVCTDNMSLKCLQWLSCYTPFTVLKTGICLPFGLCNGTLSGPWKSWKFTPATWIHKILQLMYSKSELRPVNRKRTIPAISHTPINGSHTATVPRLLRLCCCLSSSGLFTCLHMHVMYKT